MTFKEFETQKTSAESSQYKQTVQKKQIGPMDNTTPTNWHPCRCMDTGQPNTNHT